MSDTTESPERDGNASSDQTSSPEYIREKRKCLACREGKHSRCVDGTSDGPKIIVCPCECNWSGAWNVRS